MVFAIVFRTVRTPTLWSGLWLSALWAASGWTRSQSIYVSPWGSAWRTRIHMWGRRQLFAWPNFMTSMPRWWRTRASWTPSEISLLIQIPWWVSLLVIPLRQTVCLKLWLDRLCLNLLMEFKKTHHKAPLSFRLWLMQLLPCLRSVSHIPTATCWTSIPRTSTSCWRPSTSAQSGDRSSFWTACPTTTPRMSVRPKGSCHFKLSVECGHEIYEFFFIRVIDEWKQSLN